MSITKTYIDKALALVERNKEYLMYEQEVHPEMRTDADWSAIKEKSSKMNLEQDGATTELLNLISANDSFWKAIENTITDHDIEKLEAHLEITFPESYKEYLRYKHFYTIFLDNDIRFYPKPIGSWEQILKDNNEEMREILLDRGYLGIGNYSDYGEVCFDFNDSADHPAIVMIDYESGEPEMLAENFTALLEMIIAKPEPVVTELKAWEKKMYGVS
ncbi:SMI1/KNR4 family protein [Chryseobacterium sp. G0186]|uniref:SMI1/KNR4 family protein n=1 Tax=Chryseobacterium sp. G0186 TaxID=2487064 RepID=UPI000F4FF615|nr:SMI1/KNR4 family protein [Chryseobacterium sp. G0186]AZA76235.1 SMI1/KNR4 family protein [Chryseobacterium sp. G0186]